MQRDSDFTPDAACWIMVKDDDLHVVSAYWSAYGGGGHGFHKVSASHSVSNAAPQLIGQVIRTALKQFYIVPSKEEQPKRSALDELGYVNRGKFLKGIRKIMIRDDSDSSMLELSGAYSSGSFDRVNNCEAKLASDASDEAVGQAVVDMLKKIAKKVAK